MYHYSHWIQINIALILLKSSFSSIQSFNNTASVTRSLNLVQYCSNISQKKFLIYKIYQSFNNTASVTRSSCYIKVLPVLFFNRKLCHTKILHKHYKKNPVKCNISFMLHPFKQHVENWHKIQHFLSLAIDL